MGKSWLESFMFESRAVLKIGRYPWNTGNLTKFEKIHFDYQINKEIKHY